MGARRRLIAPLAALLAGLAIVACGDQDFANDPRPASPIELSARIDDGGVAVSPAKGVGAGLATITISNQSRDPAALVLEGPSDNASEEIAPGGVGSLKIDLREGDYTVSAGADSNAGESQLLVGSERPSAQNELLLP